MSQRPVRTIHNKRPTGMLVYVSNKCPKCHGGPIYRSLFSMYKACPNCGRPYEAEEGFFTGAMFLNCIFMPIMVIPTMLIFAYNDQVLRGGILSVLQIILLSPFIVRFSRILWIQACYQLDAQKKGPSS